MGKLNGGKCVLKFPKGTLIRRRSGNCSETQCVSVFSYLALFLRRYEVGSVTQCHILLNPLSLFALPCLAHSVHPPGCLVVEDGCCSSIALMYNRQGEEGKAKSTHQLNQHLLWEMFLKLLNDLYYILLTKA